MTNSAIAVEFLDAGLAVIPIRCDGSKRPTIRWQEYHNEAPTRDLVRQWFRSSQVGGAVVCGVTSCGLEVIDFDHDAQQTFPAWHRLVESIAICLPVIETPSGGYHVYYRCERICANKKIAKDGDKTLIETRGQGGYVVATFSPSEVHQRNYPYVQVAGPVLPEVPTITPQQRLQLWKAAATFDKDDIRKAAVKKLFQQQRPQKQQPGQLTPWDDYSSRGDWFDLLQRHGWTSGDGVHWRHPNASPGHQHSATLRESRSGDRVLRVFTTSTALEPEKSHSLFSVKRFLEHRGDAAATTAAVRRAGYGS